MNPASPQTLPSSEWAGLPRGPLEALPSCRPCPREPQGLPWPRVPSDAPVGPHLLGLMRAPPWSIQRPLVETGQENSVQQGKSALGGEWPPHQGRWSVRQQRVGRQHAGRRKDHSSRAMARSSSTQGQQLLNRRRAGPWGRKLGVCPAWQGGLLILNPVLLPQSTAAPCPLLPNRGAGKRSV